MGSVGQRASKLLAVKVGGLKKKSAIWPRPLSNQSARVWLCPGSNLSQSLTDSNFAALWPTDSIFTASIDLTLLKKCAKSQGCPVCFWVLYVSLSTLSLLHKRPKWRFGLLSFVITKIPKVCIYSASEIQKSNDSAFYRVTGGCLNHEIWWNEQLKCTS